MYNLIWSRSSLTRQKLGAFCEYYAKMTLASYGMDIYTAEVDDHGIDFVAEGKNGFLKFQVKSSRSFNQVTMEKNKFNIEDDSLFLFLMLLFDGEHPHSYLIPATAWQQGGKLLVSHDCVGKKSKPSHDVNISRKNMPELEKYRLETRIAFLL